MGWYKVGTVTVTNGSTTVTGSGTAWDADQVMEGDAFRGPDGVLYEIAGLVSATELELSDAYAGATTPGAVYAIVPTRHSGRAAGTALAAAAAALASGPAVGVHGAGSAVLPALRLGTALTNGFFWTAEGFPAISAGGVQRVAVTDTAVQIDRPVTGTAAQSAANDTTSGRLLKVGAFGLGGSAILYSGDIDDYNLASGFYFAEGGSTGTKPAGSYGHLIVSRRLTNSRTLQIWMNDTGKMWRRHYVSPGSGWTAWAEIYTAASILGTVSQSGGVPTGAVIERGSNANGEYVRFADGTQICTHKITLAFDSASTVRSTWFYPAAFIAAADAVIATLDGSTAFTNATPGNDEIGSVQADSSLVGSVRLNLLRLSGMTDFLSGDTVDVWVQSAGRWF